MLLPALAIGEEAGAFQRDVDAQFLVRQLGGVALGGHLDALAVDDHHVALGLHLAREGPMNAVALEQHGVRLGVGQIVDRDQLQVVIVPLQDGAGDEAADAAEAIDGDFGHANFPLFHMREHALGDLGRGQPEMLIEVGGGRRGAEPVDADAKAVEPGVALPAEGRPRLDRHAQNLAVRHVGQDILAIGASCASNASVQGIETTSAPIPRSSSVLATDIAISTSEPVAMRMTFRSASADLRR